MPWTLVDSITYATNLGSMSMRLPAADAGSRAAAGVGTTVQHMPEIGRTFQNVSSNHTTRYSDDAGVTWSAPYTVHAYATLGRIARHPGSGLLVGTTSGVGGSPTQMFTSSDNGATWALSASITTTPTEVSTIDILFNIVLGIFVAVGTSGVVLTSSDGLAWTQNSAGSGTPRHIACNQTTGRMVLIASSATTYYSDDGITWTLATTGISSLEDLKGVIYVSSLSLFVMITSYGGFSKAYTSPDGVTWTVRTAANLLYSAEAPVFNAATGEIVVVGPAAGSGPGQPSVMTSYDAVAWSVAYTNTPGTLKSVTYVPSASRLIGVDNSGALVVSPDSARWLWPGYMVGDLIVVSLAWRSTESLTVPTGWTAAAVNNGADTVTGSAGIGGGAMLYHIVTDVAAIPANSSTNIGLLANSALYRYVA